MRWWFEQRVKAGLAAIERGDIVSDEEVRAWLEERERQENVK